MKTEEQIIKMLEELKESQNIIPMHDKLLWLTEGQIKFAKWVLEWT